MNKLKRYPDKGYLDPDGFYQITPKGDVLSWKKRVSNGKEFQYVKSDTPVKLKTNKSRKGYNTITLKINGHKKTYKIYRLVAEAFIPNPEKKPQVNHTDGDKDNDDVLNLEWCTNKENARHAQDNGLLKQKKGSEHPNSKLTDKEVSSIREKYIPRKYTAKMLSQEFNMSLSTIKAILQKRLWKHATN